MEKCDFENFKKYIKIFFNFIYEKYFFLCKKKISYIKFENFQNFIVFIFLKFSNPNFSMMKKYFSSGFFFKFKRKFSAFQRTQPELLGVSERGSGTKIEKKMVLNVGFSGRFRGSPVYQLHRKGMTKIDGIS